MIPQKILCGKYAVVSKLGIGTFGEVYECIKCFLIKILGRDIVKNKSVAVKLVNAQITKNRKKIQ